MIEVERITMGEQLTYIAAEEKYIVSSKTKLVRMFKRSEEGCRRNEGSVLTFMRGADSLELEGGTQTRTQTAPDSSCPPPPKR
jgi:hypothetical protein